jgi:cytochrome c oxidase cbb3-type subunit 3
MTPSQEEIAEYPSPDGAPRDGIREEDNPIPSWFTVTFFGTIVFGVFYIPYYLFSGWSQVGQYQDEVILAEARAAAVREHLPDVNPYHGNPAAIAEGQKVFTEICVACHKPDGSGLVGPSLVDPYWKYGHSDAELFETVSGGRPLGMPPWGPVLGSEKIWKVLAYVETLPKSDEPGVGAPGYTAPGTPGS